MNKILKAAGYSVFFLVAVLVFMYWTFPMARVREYLEQEAEQRLNLNVQIAVLKLSGLRGVVAEEVMLRFPPRVEEQRGSGGASDFDPADSEEADERPALRALRIGRVEAKADLWPLLLHNRLRATAEAELLGGAIHNVEIQSEPGFTDFAVSAEEIEALALGQLQLIEDWLGFQLHGTLSGALSFKLGRSVMDSTAALDLTVDDAVLRRPRLEHAVYGEFRLTDVDLGRIRAKLVLDERGNIPALGARGADPTKVVMFEEVALEGGDIELQLEEHGTITLRGGSGPSAGLLALQGSFRIDPDFFERPAREGDDSDQPNLFVRTLLNSDPNWRRAESGGVYGFRCNGPLALASCRPGAPPRSVRYSPSVRRARAAERADRPRPREPVSAADEDADEDDAPDENHRREPRGSRREQRTPRRLYSPGNSERPVPVHFEGPRPSAPRPSIPQRRPPGSAPEPRVPEEPNEEPVYDDDEAYRGDYLDEGGDEVEYDDLDYDEGSDEYFDDDPPLEEF